MERTVFTFFALFAVAAILVFASAEEKSSPLWTRNLAIEDGIRMNWIHDDPEYVTMEISAPGKGYVAVGISPDGSMKGADMIMGWVDSQGKAHIKDTYGVRTRNTKPVEDKQSNVELIRGEETEAGTTIQFKRKWNTGDTEHDIAIKNETMIVIWAYNEVDPAVADKDGVFRPPYHQENRGSTKKNLMI